MAAGQTGLAARVRGELWTWRQSGVVELSMVRKALVPSMRGRGSVRGSVSWVVSYGLRLRMPLSSKTSKTRSIIICSLRPPVGLVPAFLFEASRLHLTASPWPSRRIHLNKGH